LSSWFSDFWASVHMKRDGRNSISLYCAPSMGAD
jgi:hypothetical protein